MAPNVWTDRVSRRGHWGEVTSTLDWCEENYVVVQFIAEFWNTVSNILLIILPLFIVYSVAVQRLGLVYIVGVLSVSVVGLGSLLFHGTLLYEMQLMDELPMLIAGAFLAFIMLTITLSDDSVWRLVIGCVLSVFCVVAIWVYLVVKDPLFHEACYGLLIGVSLFASFGTLYRHKLYRAGRLLTSGYLVTLVAFVLWNTDNTFCPNLRVLRDRSGYLGPLLELHAWWHILCGIGCHMIILSHTQLLLSYREVPYEFRYYLGCVPYIQLNRKTKHV